MSCVWRGETDGEFCVEWGGQTVSCVWSNGTECELCVKRGERV